MWRQLLSNIFAMPEDSKLKAVCFTWLWWTEGNKAKHISEWREFFAMTSGKGRPKSMSTHAASQLAGWGCIAHDQANRGCHFCCLLLAAASGQARAYI